MSSSSRTQLVKAAILAVSLLAAAACAPRPKDVPATGVIAETFEADNVPAPPEPAAPPKEVPELPPDVASALLPAYGLNPAGAGGTVMEEPRFDIAASNTSVREFLLSLVEGTRFNMVVHPDVQGNISLSLKNVTIPQVMEIIHNVYGYPYYRTEGGFQVMPAGLESRVYHVNYLNLTRRGISQTRISSGQATEQNPNQDPNQNGTGTGNYQNNKGEVNPYISGSLVNTRSEADFWKELTTAMQTIIGHEGGRRVVVQPQASLIMVRALPGELGEVENYLSILQGNLQRQVILEAKILEVELGDGFQTGINWAAMADLGNGRSATFGQTGGGRFFKDGASETSGNTGNLNPSNPAFPSGTDISAFGGVFSMALDLNNFIAFIELLETQGKVQVLSSPRISTVNNQKAVIKVGSDEYFVTDVSSDTVTGTATTATSDITLTPFFSGIALDVTPQIDPYGKVTLHIHPTVSEVTDQTKEITVAGQTQSLPLAFSTVRESDSIVSAQSGQVVVIGGLMENMRRDQTAGIPILGSIPGIGSLFRHQQMGFRKSELVILLKPVVVESGPGWAREVNRTHERFETLGQPSSNRQASPSPGY